MTDKGYDLSRRKVLAGLGTIGVAGAGAGLGTSALFSDTESFEGNMMTAGELDLAVDYVVHEYQGMAGSYTINSFTGEVNGEKADQAVALNGEGTAMSLNLGDVKPGDSGYARFCFTIDDNPAYLWACGELTNTAESAGDSPDYTEPEPEDDNGEGELEENIELTASYCNLDEEGNVIDSNGTLFTGTLDQALRRLNQGVPLDGEGNETKTRRNVGESEAPDMVPYDAGSNSENCICFEWEVPREVGNIIQGDTLSFDLKFVATQSRHNGDNYNPCGVSTSTGEGFAKQSENFNGDGTSSAGARARYGNNGPSGSWELAAGDEPGATGEFQQANYVWTSGAEVDWTADYTASSDELAFTFDGNTVTATIDDPQPDGRIAVQGKADEATVEATVDSLTIDGSSEALGGPTSVSASNDGDGREVGYLVINTALDGATDFEVSGTATVTLQNYPGSEEGVAFDVVLE